MPSKAYYQKNPEKYKQQSRKWRSDNSAYHVSYSKHYKQEHPEETKLYYRAYVPKRNADKLKQTPKWLSKQQLKDIKEFYDNCPAGYEVDHIIPLRGVNVKGLHVRWNLQYLPALENKRKGNKVYENK